MLAFCFRAEAYTNFVVINTSTSALTFLGCASKYWHRMCATVPKFRACVVGAWCMLPNDCEIHKLILGIFYSFKFYKSLLFIWFKTYRVHNIRVVGIFDLQFFRCINSVPTPDCYIEKNKHEVALKSRKSKKVCFFRVQWKLSCEWALRN